MGSRQIKISVPDSNTDVAAWIEAQEAKGPSVVELIRWFVRHFGHADPRNDVDLAAVSIDMSEGRRVPLAARAPVAQQFQLPPVQPVVRSMVQQSERIPERTVESETPASLELGTAGIIHVSGQSTVEQTMMARERLSPDLDSDPVPQTQADSEQETEREVEPARPAPATTKRSPAGGRGMNALKQRTDDEKDEE